MTHLTKTGSDIPADHIQFNDDHTKAWWLVPTLFGMPFVKFPDGFMDVRNAFDRPCDTCKGGILEVKGDGMEWLVDCPDCLNGRHTFTIDAPHGRHGALTLPLRVSVVPDTVLPIHDECPEYDPPDHICQAWGNGQWVWHKSDHVAGPDGPTEVAAILPSAARRGMWAVKLNVHN
jgi:hypothetical protein